VLSGEVHNVLEEHKRVDAKCGTYISIAGVGLAFLLTQTGTREPIGVRLVLAAAGIAFATAVILLLLGALRPRLGTSGFCRWSTMTADEIGDLFTVSSYGRQDTIAQIQPESLHILSLWLMARQRVLKRAADIFTCGVALLGAAMLAAMLT
jgi:hypothetical protein